MLFCDPQEEYGGGKLCAKNGTWSEILAPHPSIIDCGCHMPETCLWQTCRYGNSSQEWSVNCGLEDSGCQDKGELELMPDSGEMAAGSSVAPSAPESWG